MANKPFTFITCIYGIHAAAMYSIHPVINAAFQCAHRLCKWHPGTLIVFCVLWKCVKLHVPASLSPTKALKHLFRHWLYSLVVTLLHFGLQLELNFASLPLQGAHYDRNTYLTAWINKILFIMSFSKIKYINKKLIFYQSGMCHHNKTFSHPWLRQSVNLSCIIVVLFFFLNTSAITEKAWCRKIYDPAKCVLLFKAWYLFVSGWNANICFDCTKKWNDCFVNQNKLIMQLCQEIGS